MMPRLHRDGIVDALFPCPVPDVAAGAWYNAGMTTTLGAMHDGIEASPAEGQASDALETTAFTVTVERAAEHFRQAGFPRSTDHISRWCRQGMLRAIKQPTRNGLSRYLIEQQSLDEAIERLRREKHEREHPHIFETVADTPAARRHDADADDATMAPPQHHNGNGDAGMPPSFPAAMYDWSSEREDAAELRGELRALKEQARTNAGRIEKLENENGNLRLSLGEFKGKAEAYEKQVLQLMAPKPAEPEGPAAPAPTPTPTAIDDDTTTAPTPTSWWRRFFGSA
jgi:hypothetical protein